jgi:ABC-type Zn uptake system ZnuABC Zn-binding protein ZnuA
MKRLSFIGIVVLIMALALSGCGASETGGAAEGAAGATSEPATADLADGARLSVVATTSIVGDIVRNVGGEAIDLTVLLPAGTSPHSFSPTRRTWPRWPILTW